MHAVPCGADHTHGPQAAAAPLCLPSCRLCSTTALPPTRWCAAGGTRSEMFRGNEVFLPFLECAKNRYGKRLRSGPIADFGVLTDGCPTQAGVRRSPRDRECLLSGSGGIGSQPLAITKTGAASRVKFNRLPTSDSIIGAGIQCKLRAAIHVPDKSRWRCRKMASNGRATFKKNPVSGNHVGQHLLVQHDYFIRGAGNAYGSA